MLEKDEILKRKKEISEEERCLVYFLIKDNEIVYVGQTIQGLLRVYTHCGQKDFDSYFAIKCEKEKLNEVEASYIVKFNPVLNGNLPKNTIFAGKQKIKKQLRIEGHAFNFIIRRYGIKMYAKNQLKIKDVKSAFEQAKKDNIICYVDGFSINNDWFLTKNAPRLGVNYYD